jgi:BolA protein
MRPGLDELRARFAAAFPGDPLELADDSHLHAGHAGAAGGAGHYTLRVVSARFEGLSTVARHRLVYDAVRDWMPHRVHALVIVARSPAEADRS